MEAFDIYRSEPIEGQHYDFDFVATVKARDAFSAIREGREREGYTSRDSGLWEARPASPRISL